MVQIRCGARCCTLALVLGWLLGGTSGRALAQPGSAEDDRPQTGPISGYMELHFNDDQGKDPVLDFHRFVLLFNHSFTSRLRFVGELEVEHALVEGLEDAGELELEQAYLDFLIKRSLN